MKKRGTWFNRGNKTWYEIDGFITREEDRQKIVKAVKIKSSEMLSDHKIVEMKLKMRTPRYSNERKQKKRRNLVQHEKAATFLDILKSFFPSDTRQCMKR